MRSHLAWPRWPLALWARQRGVLASIILACLAEIIFLAPAHAFSEAGGPDSVRVLGPNGYQYVDRSGAAKGRFGVRVVKSKPRAGRALIGGKTFERNPATVSFHSNAAPWLAEAKRHVGRGNPTSRRSLWCARFVNDVLARTGKSGTGSDLARSFTSYGTRLSGPMPGAIAVYARGRSGGHVAVVEAVNGNTVTLVSGNCGRAGVCRYTRSVGSALAYVWPEA